MNFLSKFKELPKEYALTQEDKDKIAYCETHLGSVTCLRAIRKAHDMRMPLLQSDVNLARELRSSYLLKNIRKA